MNERLAVAVDAMGGDYAPQEIVAGAVLAARELPVEVILVGPADRLRSQVRELGGEALPIQIVDAPEVIEMAEAPAMALRRKPQGIDPGGGGAASPGRGAGSRQRREYRSGDGRVAVDPRLHRGDRPAGARGGVSPRFAGVPSWWTWGRTSTAGPSTSSNSQSWAAFMQIGCSASPSRGSG